MKNININAQARANAEKVLRRLQEREQEREQERLDAAEAARESERERFFKEQHERAVERAIANAPFDVRYVNDSGCYVLFESATLDRTNERGGIYGYHMNIRQWMGGKPFYWIGVSAPKGSFGYWSLEFPFTEAGKQECMAAWERVVERCERSWNRY